jgi:hypothetical protein
MPVRRSARGDVPVNNTHCDARMRGGRGFGADWNVSVSGKSASR